MAIHVKFGYLVLNQKQLVLKCVAFVLNHSHIFFLRCRSHSQSSRPDFCIGCDVLYYIWKTQYFESKNLCWYFSLERCLCEGNWEILAQQVFKFQLLIRGFLVRHFGVAFYITAFLYCLLTIDCLFVCTDSETFKMGSYSCCSHHVYRGSQVRRRRCDMVKVTIVTLLSLFVLQSRSDFGYFLSHL